MAIQYTIRNIPPEVDKALKQRAKITRKSFNQIVVEELAKNIQEPEKSRFEWLVGTMDDNEAKIFNEAIDDLNRPDAEFWQ